MKQSAFFCPESRNIGTFQRLRLYPPLAGASERKEGAGIMRVLVACEESQRVCIAFRERGHEAYSCDIQECSGGHPEWHIKGDALELIDGQCRFQTMDGEWHCIYGAWDLLIAHPPCTYLTAASAVRLFNKNHEIKDVDRWVKAQNAKAFFMKIYGCQCAKIAIENPVPLRCFHLTKYSQIIEPYMFGDPWKKRTCLWLKRLPKLQATEMVEPKGLFVGSTSKRRDKTIKERYELNSIRDSKQRSKTFPGIARAMAEQWGG